MISTSPVSSRLARSSLASLALFGCNSPRFELASPWPADQVAVIVVLDENNAVVTGPELLRAGGTFDVVIDTEIHQRILAKTFRDGMPNFDECGYAIGGEGGGASPIGSWISNVIDPEDDLSMTEEATPTELDLRLPNCPDDSNELCRRTIVRQIPISLTGNFTDVAMESDDTAFAVLASDTSDDSFLLRWDAETSSVVQIDLGAPVVSVASARRNVTWVGLRGGAVVAIDETNTIFGPIETGLMNPMVENGVDRTLIAYDASGAVEIPFPTTDAVARSDFPPRIESLFVSRADRMFVVTEGSIYAYDGAWKEELSNARLGGDFFVFGDQSYAGAIGFFELFERDEANYTWTQVEMPPTATFSAYAAVYLGNGVSLAVADTGYAGLIANGVPCKIETGTLNPLRAVDAVSSAFIGMIAGENSDPGTMPFWATIDLPAP